MFKDGIKEANDMFRDKVVEKVKEMIGNESWFRGVCMDDIESFIINGDLKGAVNHAYNQTLYWDGEYNFGE